MKQRECALWTDFPLPGYFVLRVLGWVWICGTRAERRFEIVKYRLASARYSDVGLRTLMIIFLIEITETIFEIPFTVDYSSNVGSGDIADLFHIDSSQS